MAADSSRVPGPIQQWVRAYVEEQLSALRIELESELQQVRALARDARAKATAGAALDIPALTATLVGEARKAAREAVKSEAAIFQNSLAQIQERMDQTIERDAPTEALRSELADLDRRFRRFLEGERYTTTRAMVAQLLKQERRK